jgi:glycosyltransferase involved in cell wall biosynthesis/SAM-dependent methyltransferase
MTHPQQLAYFERIQDLFGSAFANAENILEVGSQNINGTVRDFFAANTNYLGIDIGKGKDVDFVIPGELVELPDGWADIAISTECFEHAENWKDILLNMIRITKPQGLILLTFAGKGRAVHGTLDSDVFSSPFTTTYYQNLAPDDVARDIAIGKYFLRHGFEVDSIAHDTYFWGIRNNDNPADPDSAWETLECRLVRAQGQLSQAVSIYNGLKVELNKSQSAYEQLSNELAEAQLKLKASQEHADVARSKQTNASLQAQRAQSSAAQAIAQKDQARREVIELSKVLSEERNQIASRLRAADQERLAIEQERKQTAIRLRAVEEERLAIDQERAQALTALENVRQQAASARQEAEIAREQSHENWLVTMEIMNSRIWRGTQSIRNIKDGLRQRLRTGLNTFPQPNPPDSAPSSHAAPQIKATPKTNQEAQNKWLQEHFDQDWKFNQDLIRQSSQPNHRSPKGGPKTIIIDWKCPEVDKDSGSYRMDAIIRIMLELGIDVSFFSQAVNQEATYINRLRNLNLPTYLGIDLAVKHLSEAGQSYEYVILARPDTAEVFLPFIQLYCPKAKLIYDTVDLHYLRMRRALRLLSEDSEVEKNSLLMASEHYYAKELIISRSSDKVIVVSDEEKKFLADEDATLDIVTIPNIHTIAEHTPGFGERSGLLFVGGFDHQPNKDAMIFFCKEIMPKIAETLDDIIMTIVGSNMPDEIFALESKHVKPVGYVENLDPILARARIFVAPLRYGAGMKGKVGLSMSHGIPVVGTSIAAEGFGLVDGREMLITDNPNQLAEYTINLYRNQELWTKLSTQGKIFIRENYSPAVIKDRIANLFNPTTYNPKGKTYV